ncbi:hypothetical protein C731_0763 [Mycolicibacterium hassiacum DSM 44199]|uniref:Low molecular weight antigen MTB12-like C-terminal domain-containing protein n=1 Tax=Mycolicibacterium hassiacum (strain DSM 44199 / CIP 105218 / JCM 12690 / 3849) TaxID=1122247 RepID=K5BHV6_MYCHD|nr:hypothetical protein [Mycolicibacterium hassiacum]EKF25236.1 hypothetical protein C731_0763 [Mycolicibacterium hassiacum DSM 44199]MBX5487380.1 hypothetical protein [Mycolicibacterium hassiacum]VCT89188.1 hypothetical protein MHAS_00875 [Mycolicibacterium hassiacum DSM 44199]
MPRHFAVIATLLIAVVTAMGAAPTASAQPAPTESVEDFAITSEVPTVEELDAQIRLLVATQAPDWVKAAQLEGGDRAVIVPKMIYRLGFFRAPRGYSQVTGPETHDGDRHTAIINAHRQGAPTIQVEAEWRRIDGRWKLASKSLCNGIKTIGLPIPCNFE